jgi:pSer/pThr/pTyr-binding forkhead associated (FHA) protein
MRGAVVEQQVVAGQRTHCLAEAGAQDQSPAYVLRGVTGLVFGRTFAIDQSVTVGRAPVCDIVIQEHTLSRCHVRLLPTAEGMLVQDLGSTNGTYINGQRISQWIARAGDELRLDCIRFLIERPSSRSLTVASARATAPH